MVWQTKVRKACLFFLIGLVILSLYRFVFFIFYSSGDSNITLMDFFPAVWTGVRVDAKWLGLALIPAWLALIFSCWVRSFYIISCILAGIGYFLMILLDAGNFGFYGFYKTPISALVYGLLQDDTKAIIETIWEDWPVVSYLIVILVSVAIPFLCCRMVKSPKTRSPMGRGRAFVLGLCITLVLAVIVRGSLTKFPLRQEDFSVSKISLINSCVPNGAAAFYEATKAWKNTQIAGDPNQALRKFGYVSREEAEKKLTPSSKEPVAPPDKPNVVFAVMESMSADIFLSHNPSKGNNTLGSLEQALSSAVVFKKAVSIMNGTFPSLEGLIFDTPITPISQGIYGRKKLSFSRIFEFKKEGYKTVFLTGAPESWRQINETFRNFGFDEVIGSAAISERFPNAELSPWGIGDKWMFKYAEDILDKAEKDKQPVFIMMLSTTNHPPFKVPDNEIVQATNFSVLPDYVKKDSSEEQNNLLLQTYQYAADNLGKFVLDLDKNGWLKNTIVAATGDHNARLKYIVDGNWHHVYGVPIVFWIPDAETRQLANTNKWASHRDIIPTLLSAATGAKSGISKGRNLFAKEKIPDGAVSFISWDNNGFTIGDAGLVTLKGGNSYDCYKWHGDTLQRSDSCTNEQLEMGEIARAQRALSELIVREGLIAK